MSRIRHPESVSRRKLMSVSAISSGAAPVVEPSQRTQEDVAGRQLIQALNSGDLGEAQQAYNTLASFGPNNSGPFTSPALTQEFQTLGQDIQSGNLSAAQQQAQAVGQGQLKLDVNAALQDYTQGGWSAARQAVANLQGDFWAVYGTQTPLPGVAPGATGNSGSGSSVNVNA
jgi:hypothetical protein